MEVISCSICLNSASILHKITELTENEVLTPMFKLITCLPNIKWLNSYNICNLCSENVGKAYNFYEMCSKSECLRSQIKIEHIKVELDQDDLITGENKRPSFEQNVLVELRRICNICSNFTKNLSKISGNIDDNSNALPFISKLNVCVPNIEWLDNFDICNLCIENLNQTYDFCLLCFNNKIICRRETVKEIKIEKIECNGPTYTEFLNNCTYCEEMFDSKQQLIVHIRSKHSKKSNLLFICDHCNKKYKRKRFLLIHLTKVHGTGVKKKKMQMKLRFPARKLTKVHKCEHCIKKYKWRQTLKIHLKQVHQIGNIQIAPKHKCNICAKRFHTPSKLKQHLRGVHLNIRDFKCVHCNNEYKTLQTLQIHLKKVHRLGDIKIVPPERKHACHVCAKRFCQPSKLKRHMRTHSNACDFKCPDCDKEYKHEESLHLHLIQVHQVDVAEIRERFHECDQCSKRFLFPSMLKEHLILHSNGSVLIKCDVCNKEYKTKRGIQRHMKYVHTRVTNSGSKI